MRIDQLRAIDSDERLRRTRALGMHIAGEQHAAGTGFARDQYRRAVQSDLLGLFARFGNSRRLTLRRYDAARQAGRHRGHAARRTRIFKRCFDRAQELT